MTGRARTDALYLGHPTKSQKKRNAELNRADVGKTLVVDIRLPSDVVLVVRRSATYLKQVHGHGDMALQHYSVQVIPHHSLRVLALMMVATEGVAVIRVNARLPRAAASQIIHVDCHCGRYGCCGGLKQLEVVQALLEK